MLIVVGACLWRCAAANNDLWLDEIWSLRAVMELTSPWQVFTAIHSDNNHYLNSLWLYWLGDGWRGSLIYRSVPVFWGTLTVVAAAWLGARESSTGRWVYALLFASSFGLVQYSSEARGYGSLFFFCLLSYGLASTATARRDLKTCVGFSLSLMLGMLSHPCFVQAAAGLGVWLGLEFWKRRQGWRDFFLRLGAYFGPALALIVALWWVDLRHLHPGGANRLGVLLGAHDALRWLWTGLDWPAVTWLSGLLVGALLLSLLQYKSRECWFFLVSILVAPPAFLALARIDFVHPRYFLVSVIFLLVLLARQLSRQLESAHRIRRWGAACLLFLFVAANLSAGFRLIRLGRGDYREALQWICDQSPGRRAVSLGGDNDFRNSVVVDFYAGRLKTSPSLRYFRQSEWPSGGPDWLLIHALQPEPQVPPRVLTPTASYAIRRRFYAAPLSGWQWFVYQKE
ncbi:hypothetical protein IV102_20700 [bacterium]|nr:hypothetical protein [bacterium]